MSDSYREQTLAYWLNSSESAAVDPLAEEFDDLVVSGSADQAPAAVVEQEQMAQAAKNDELVFEEEDALPRIAAFASMQTSSAADEHAAEIDPRITLSFAPGADLGAALFDPQASSTLDFAISGAFAAVSSDAPAPDLPDHVPASASAPGPEENGSGDTAVAVAASGNQQIDGLLSGSRWADGFITYSDPDAVADYQVGHPEPFTNFSQVSAQQMIAVHFGLNSAIFSQPVGAAGFGVEGFTNLGIDYAGSGSGAGTIRVANTTDPGTAYAYYPNNGVFGGDAFFGPSGDFPTAGNYDWHTVLHELGHSLGLAHGHTGGGFGALPGDVDSQEFSIMTYRTYIGQPISGYSYETWGAPQTFMMLDIAALQYMYGADYTTNSGNTVYTWSPTTGETIVNGNIALDPGGNRIFATIWDGGGTDTYDLSNYATNMNIDLRPGQHSVFSSGQLAFLGGGPNGGFARGNIFNALLFAGSTASLIENANGGAGNDTMRGNQANNVLNGNGGNDTLFGESGNDTLNGGDGNDVIDDGSGGDAVDGGNGDDRAVMGDAAISGDVYNGGAGVDTFDASHFTWATDVTIDLTAAVWSYSAGSETVAGFENIFGADGSVGTTETLRGNASNNIIYGNGGVDVIDGEAGDDYLDGGAEADTINGDDGNDTILGGSGDDTINGGDGNDTINGGSGDDTILGGNGDDVLTAGSGVDLVYGNAGDDRFYIETGWNGGVGEAFFGGAGVDTFDTSTVIFPGFRASVNLRDGEFYDLDAPGSGPISLSSVENVITGDGDDVVTGSGEKNNISTGEGNDTLYGLGGNDILGGGLGNDLLEGGDGADYHSGGGGSDTVSYAGALAAVWASLANPAINTGEAAGDTYNSIENMIGSDFDDSLNATNGANDVRGGTGNDTLKGYAGSDQLYGQDGNDTLVGGQDADYLSGGVGNDTASYAGASAGVIASLANPAINTGEAAGDTYNSIENMIGTDFDDSLNANAGANDVRGGAGNDTLKGYAGNDQLYGQDGNDTLIGGEGADYLSGGVGNDTASYAGASAGVTVSLSNSAINAGDAAGDTYNSIENLAGTSYGDSLNGTNAGNIITGGAGDDLIKGYLGDDVLTGGAGADVFIFNTAPNNATNVDQIEDYSVSDDSIWLDDAIFTAFAGSPGAILPGHFRINATGLAQDANDYIIYDTDDGRLWYDVDGVGGSAGVRFASLDTGLALTNADFLVV